MSHTPGPWTFRPGSGLGFYVEGRLEKENGHWLIAEACGRSNQNEANARLIAAAPDLLSALERIEYSYALLLAGKPVRDAAETLAECRAAIKKARG